MSRSSTPGYLTPNSESRWTQSCQDAKLPISQSELASLIASKLASRQSSRRSSRQSTPSRTPRYSRSAMHSASLYPIQEKPRPQPLSIPQPLDVYDPQTPPRGWTTPPHRKSGPIDFAIPCKAQNVPVVRMAYTNGNGAAFLEAPIKQGSSFSFEQGQSKFQFNY